MLVFGQITGISYSFIVVFVNCLLSFVNCFLFLQNDSLKNVLFFQVSFGPKGRKKEMFNLHEAWFPTDCDIPRGY